VYLRVQCLQWLPSSCARDAPLSTTLTMRTPTSGIPTLIEIKRLKCKCYNIDKYFSLCFADCLSSNSTYDLVWICCTIVLYNKVYNKSTTNRPHWLVGQCHWRNHSATLRRFNNNNNNNNKNNIQDIVYGAVIMAEPLREFTRFI